MANQLDDLLSQQEDDTVIVDFSEAAEGFDPLPDGDYVAVVESVKSGTSKNGNAKLTWRFQVIEGPYAKRVLFKHTPIVGNGTWFTREIFAALGISTDDSQVKFRLSQATGKKVVLSVVRQKDKSEFNEVSKVKAYAGALQV